MYISPVVGGLESKFQKLFGGFHGGSTQRKWFGRCHVTDDVIMATSRPETYLFPAVGELESKFQMHFRICQGRPTRRKWFRQCHVTGDVTFPTWRPTKSDLWLYLLLWCPTCLRGLLSAVCTCNGLAASDRLSRVKGLENRRGWKLWHADGSQIQYLQNMASQSPIERKVDRSAIAERSAFRDKGTGRWESVRGGGRGPLERKFDRLAVKFSR